VPQQFFAEGLDDGVRQAVETAIDTFEAGGAIIDRTVELPSSPAALPVYYIIAPSEASANLARYDGVKYGFSFTEGESVDEEMSETRARGFGDEVKRRIMIGTYALSAGYYDAYYLKAQKVRTLIRREFEAAFTDHDLLLTPTTPTAAFGLGEKLDDPFAMYLNDLYTLPVNIAGNPALSIPCGLDQGLPVGLHLIGRPFDEATLLQASHAFEAETDWHRQAPASAS
jgi:aspartyl-tRNA(Asn)/glutamyl-tRNA(Gln) amidotransferase subunit A